MVESKTYPDNRFRIDWHMGSISSTYACGLTGWEAFFSAQIGQALNSVWQKVHQAIGEIEQQIICAPATFHLSKKRFCEIDPYSILCIFIKHVSLFFQAKLETKALKAKRPGFTDERYNETSYYHDPESSKSPISLSFSLRKGRLRMTSHSFSPSHWKLTYNPRF